MTTQAEHVLLGRGGGQLGQLGVDDVVHAVQRDLDDVALVHDERHQLFDLGRRQVVQLGHLEREHDAHDGVADDHDVTDTARRCVPLVDFLERRFGVEAGGFGTARFGVIGRKVGVQVLAEQIVQHLDPARFGRERVEGLDTVRPVPTAQQHRFSGLVAPFRVADDHVGEADVALEVVEPVPGPARDLQTLFGELAVRVHGGLVGPAVADDYEAPGVGTVEQGGDVVHGKLQKQGPVRLNELAKLPLFNA